MSRHVRLAAALVLAQFLGADVLAHGLGSLADPWLSLFPYLWLFLILDHLISAYRINDAQVFLLGCSFSFLYTGVFTKTMHDGIAVTGLDWVAILGGPFEWGMFAVLWFHALAAVFPRRRHEYERSWLGWAALAAISGGVVMVYLLKSYYGHYRVERLLSSLWPIDDLILAFAAWRLARRARESMRRQSAYTNSGWVWALAGAGLWLLGSSVLAQLCSALSLPHPLFYSVQISWGLVLAVLGYNTWRGRLSFDEEPIKRSRLVLLAAGARVLGTLLLLKLFGPDTESPRSALWTGLICDLPSKLLFYYAFLTSRLEV